MYSFLRGEMIKAGITVLSLSKKIGVSEKTLRNKLKGNTDFTWLEALNIRNIVNPQMEIEKLFTADSKEQEV